MREKCVIFWSFNAVQNNTSLKQELSSMFVKPGFNAVQNNTSLKRLKIQAPGRCCFNAVQNNTSLKLPWFSNQSVF